MKGHLSLTIRIFLLMLLSNVPVRGEDAGGILAGVAAIIQAAAPIGVAAIQAKADVKIAQIQTDTTKEVSYLQSDLTKDLAGKQQNIEFARIGATAEINRINNEAATDRLAMQLAEVRDARKDALQSEREKRHIEWQYNQQRIALARQQAADNYKLAQMTLNAQLVQAGLITGMRSIDSSKGLKVTRVSFGNQPVSVSTLSRPQYSFVDSTFTARGAISRFRVGGSIGRGAFQDSVASGSTNAFPNRLAAAQIDLTSFRQSVSVPGVRHREVSSVPIYENRSELQNLSEFVPSGGHRPR